MRSRDAPHDIPELAEDLKQVLQIENVREFGRLNKITEQDGYLPELDRCTPLPAIAAIETRSTMTAKTRIVPIAGITRWTDNSHACPLRRSFSLFQGIHPLPGGGGDPARD
jgi:hypothetical protein